MMENLLILLTAEAKKKSGAKLEVGDVLTINFTTFKLLMDIVYEQTARAIDS